MKSARTPRLRYLRYRSLARFSRNRYGTPRSDATVSYLDDQASRLSTASVVTVVSVDTNNEKVTATAHGFGGADEIVGPIRFIGSTLPTGLAEDTDYWARITDANVFVPYLTQADAETETLTVNIKSAISGTTEVFLYVDDDAIFDKLKAGKTIEEVRDASQITELTI